MKKMIALLTVMAIFCCGLFLCAEAKNEDVAENIVYEVYDCYWDGGKLVVKGCIANLNEKYDILGLEDTTLQVTDANGLEFSVVKLNEEFQKSCLLRPMSKVPYNFTITSPRYSKNKYTSLTKGLQVYFSTLTCKYGTCSGKKCENCHYNGYDLTEDPFARKEGYNASASGVEWLCTLCRQTGKCSSCGGDGVDETMKGSIWGTRCTLCSGTGKCIACGGDGIRP